MNNSVYLRGFLVALVALCLGLVAVGSATAAPYQFDPVLSLTGNCNESAIDPIPDPGCPYPAPPNGPSGRFSEPRSTVVDTFGNEYVVSFGGGDGTKGRIDVFDDEGFFITEFADPHGPQSVAVDSKGNLYAFEQVVGSNAEVVRYTPTVYKPEEGEIAYSGASRTLIATDVNRANGGVAVDFSTDHLFATNSGNSVLEYSSAEEGNNLLATITHPKLNSVNWVAVDGQRRRLFVSYCKEGIEKCGVLVFDADAPHELLEEIDGSNVPAGKFLSTKGWLSIAVDEETGNFFIDDLEQSDNVYLFDENYEYLETITSAGFQGGNPLQIGVSNAEGANNHRYLFVPVVIASGRALAFSPPGECAPSLEGVRADNVAETEAELLATVEPCQGETTWIFEYVTEAQFEAEGFAGAQIGGEGTIPAGSLSKQVGALLTGLTPETSYRFRVIAKNLAGEEEAEGAFTTYADAAGTNECPNQALRSGLSALLPDCRAYELVTPADMNGRPPKGVGFSGDRFSTIEATPAGNAVSFLTEGGALPGAGGSGAFDGDLYRSVRGSSGWTTASAGPSGDEASLPLTGSTSPDQGFAFWTARGEGSAVVEEGAHYVRYPDGHSELVGRGSLDPDDAQAEGKLITEGGTHIVFQTRNVPPITAQQLEPNAPPTGTTAVYDRTSDEVTHVVSLLPGDVSPAAGEDANYVGASGDGEGIAFSIDSTLYLRVGNAATYEIGENVEYAGVSEGGERIFYVEGGDLYALDTTTEAKERIPFTEVGNAVVVNVAPDGTRAYFVSTTAIPGSGESPNGTVAQNGKPNLYLSEEGEISFVATVTPRDVEGELNSVDAQVDGIGLWTVALENSQPARDVTRLTPDGSVLLFQSRANLDGYDPEGFPQLYRYDSTANRLHCISCIPTKAAATGAASLETFAAEQLTSPPFSVFGFVTNLSSDGKRAFFESDEALVSTDTDDIQDVYEWEENGVGSCERAAGCIYLITSGQSGRDNYLYAVSRSGDDVFFITEDTLVPGDESTLSIYDARVGGGFPQAPEDECVGEGCKPLLTPPPALIPPARPAAGADDNVRPAPKSRKCPKGKRKVKRHGKVRCVKKHHKKKQAKAGTTRRAGR